MSESHEPGHALPEPEDRPDHDLVDEEGEESLPASDPPANY